MHADYGVMRGPVHPSARPGGRVTGPAISRLKNQLTRPRRSGYIGQMRMETRGRRTANRSVPCTSVSRRRAVVPYTPGGAVAVCGRPFATGLIAQLAERVADNDEVAGSSPAGPIIPLNPRAVALHASRAGRFHSVSLQGPACGSLQNRCRTLISVSSCMCGVVKQSVAPGSDHLQVIPNPRGHQDRRPKPIARHGDKTAWQWAYDKNPSYEPHLPYCSYA